MKKLLFLGCCLLMISALSSCRGNSGKAAAAAGAAIIHEVVNDNDASGSNVSFKGANKGRCQSGGTYYKRTSRSDKSCYWCGESWSDHIGATGSAPENWD